MTRLGNGVGTCVGGARGRSAVKGSALVVALGLIACVGFLAPAREAGAADKIKLEKLDDLPRHTYPIQGTASDLLASREKLMTLAAQVKRDTQEILDTYDIQDRNTLQGMYGVLQTISYLEGDEAKTRAYLEKARSLEEKEAARLTQGLLLLAYYDARSETGRGPETPEFRAMFRKRLEAALRPLPWGTVQDNIEQMKGNLEILSEPLVLGIVSGTIDPAVAKSGQVSGEVAAQLLSFRQAMDLAIPLKAEAASVLDAYVQANRVEKADIWAARSVILEPAPGPKVRIGVWDTGVDVTVFEGSLWTNPKETINGKDDDGNGFVDDVHGIAHDKDHQRSPLLLYPLGDAEGRRGDLEGVFKGLFDLQAALDSPEAKALRIKLSALSPEKASAFMEDLGLYTHHAHGTHVAGIALAGNPRAEVVVARLGTDHRLVPDPPTMATTQAFARELQETVDYFKAAGVRVVNMSWVLSPKGFEDDLEKNGIGKDQAERAELARAMFAVAKDALRKAFESAPEILFVGGAGNSDNDVDFDEFVPPAFDLPNLVIAGAVDQAGDATGFTSFGKGVDVYSNGFEVDSFVPGGHHMKLSGTSMASPNVANLAAKLIALEPSLEPAQTIDLIRRGAESRGDKGQLLVINPKESVRLLEEMRKTRG